MLIPAKRYGCPFSVSFVPLRLTNPVLGDGDGDGDDDDGDGDGDAIAVGVGLGVGFGLCAEVGPGRKPTRPAAVPLAVAVGVLTGELMLTWAVRSAIVLLTESGTAALALLPPPRTRTRLVARPTTARTVEPATSRLR